MSKQTESSRFIFPPFRQYARFYQDVIDRIATLEEFAGHVLKGIRTAYAFRQVERVRELSNILINLPLREYRIIGQYYLVWCQFRERVCNYAALDSIIEQTRTYKSKSLCWRAGFEVYKGDSETALTFYSEALKANPTVSERIVVSRGIALAKSIEGFHASASKDLECLIPLLRYAEPMTYYDVLNSYAVELIEANRLTEAENVSLSVVSSPLAPYYPEWQETREDINERRVSRAKATFSAPTVSEPSTLLHMPVRERSAPEPFTAQLPRQKQSRKKKAEAIHKKLAVDWVDSALAGFAIIGAVLASAFGADGMHTALTNDAVTKVNPPDIPKDETSPKPQSVQQQNPVQQIANGKQNQSANVDNPLPIPERKTILPEQSAASDRLFVPARPNVPEDAPDAPTDNWMKGTVTDSETGVGLTGAIS